MRNRIEAVRNYLEQVGETHSIMGWVEGTAAEAADLTIFISEKKA